jgi:hypothetical protein
MDDTVDDDFIELPKQLTGRDVALFLDPFGFQASTQMDWQKGGLMNIGPVVSVLPSLEKES